MTQPALTCQCSVHDCCSSSSTDRHTHSDRQTNRFKNMQVNAHQQTYIPDFSSKIGCYNSMCFWQRLRQLKLHCKTRLYTNTITLASFTSSI